ncbi:D-inositol-3-phosphate glycosyltransferase [Streptosporangium lutulentum]|uniref:D-inositol-3-phosphate glycosyltransferase n=2 Tax=Streptosporangium lutulentum TaxID=1461250 RepID=A0ABT9QHN6_9ACTN|nr:D-inositol-3-phosphate glycosyltransferase [Streptosporangium lutulentum]MDP9846266.1 D-inositol-3-phosphate glycosyltransferase [Streptosporangium lutulentum]
MPRRLPRRIATVSVLTSPFAQPGGGDAGGLNVYIVEVARRMAALDVEMEIFTRAVSPDMPPLAELVPGVLVRHVAAGPPRELGKNELPGTLARFTSEMLRTGAARERGGYDLIHAHHWLAGKVGASAKKRWDVPLVQSMHSLGAVKNAALVPGEEPEPAGRIAGETEVVAAADRLVANTVQEANQLITLYGADPARVRTVNPGVDLSLFRPGSQARARHGLGLPVDAVVLLFAGRVQPLKAPDVLLRAAARMIRHDPGLARRLVVAIVGGPSGAGLTDPDHLGKLAAELGIAGRVRLEPPCPQPELADWYRAATAVVVPSHAETFGLVAVEAQACGTPVVAAAVGGLRTAVRDGISGVLVDGHDPARYARALGDLVSAPRHLRRLQEGALAHASRFGWEQAVDRLLTVYDEAVNDALTTVDA